MEKLTPWDIAKTINTKSGRMEIEKGMYDSFVMNKVFSNTQDSVFFANEVNGFTKNIDEQMQYDFYYYGLSKASRYGKWFKIPKCEDKDIIEYVQNYFNYSKEKAVDAISCFDEETIEAIKDDIKLMTKTIK